MLKEQKNGYFARPFLPTLAMIRSFAELCDSFRMAPVLAHFDPARPIYLETDASCLAIAGSIKQQQDDACDSAAGSACIRAPFDKGHLLPVAFWSQSISPAELCYSVGDQEMLAIVMPCRH